MVVDGDEDGVSSFIAQVAAPEGEVFVDSESALAVLDDIAFTAPLNAEIRNAANDWIRANPDGDVRTINDIRVSYFVDADQLVLGFTYPPRR